MKRAIAVILLLAALLGAVPARAEGVAPSDYNMQTPWDLQAGHLFAQSALLIDEDSGVALFSKDAGIRMYPASTTKIMTLLLALESDIGLDERVTIPAEAADVPKGSSVIPVEPGDVMSFRDLLYGFMLSSGNDGANAIAVLVDGSISAFVARMNQKAETLGCTGTHFVNAHGYHDPKHYTTARDLAIMACAAMRNADFRAIVAAPSWDMTVTRNGKTGTGTIISRNSLLQSDEKYYYADCTGIKTGHHSAAGWCFVGSAERDGMRLICVVLNCEKEADKWYDAARLFEYGFTRYADVPVREILERAKDDLTGVSIENAASDDPNGGTLNLDLAPTEGADATVKVISDSADSLAQATDRLKASAQIEWLRPLTAPVEAGEALGMLHCALPDGTTFAAQLTASRAVAAEAAHAEMPVATVLTEETSEPAQEARPGSMRPFAILLCALLALCAGVIVVLILLERKRQQARRRAAQRRRRQQANRNAASKNARK